ncbi:TPA: bifunctional glutamate--cysteine ligase GshA/glutathione synthetase GshB [Streptococcus agalactiae]
MIIDRLLQRSHSHLPILQATFGLERESLRIHQPTQRVAQTPHPKTLGSRNYHPYIQTDYSEPQLELITPIAKDSQEAIRFLKAISDVAGRSINHDEYLWPLSMPPKVREEDIQIAQLEDAFEYDYRKYLEKTYGKLIQSISGIHYNLGLGQELLTSLFELSQADNAIDFQNQLYMKLSQNFLRYRWLLTYLYGASPVAEEDFLDQKLNNPVRSLRNSHLGYVNHKDIRISYTSLKDYVNDLENAVKSGQLIAEKEFYSPVRLRGSKACRNYLEKGITYLEFRTFDLNPFSPIGITQETVDTVHLFLLALLWIDSSSHIDQDIKEANRLNDLIALSHPLEKLPNQAPVSDLVDAMQSVIQHFNLSPYYQDLLESVKRQIQSPELTVAGQLLEMIEGLSLETFGQRQGQIYHDYAWEAPYALKGYETMELSTQLLLFDVIQKGVNFEVLDEQDQFLKLWHNSHIEYVKNGNMTSKDNYIVPLAMANKVVTKKILDEKHFPTPFGDEFTDRKEALNYFSQIQDKPIVVKPKSTNFGLGISIFKTSANLASYEKAIDIAFTEDNAILVEEYIEGTEYRFFVLEGDCIAVLLRVAANVVGDGIHTISQLVKLKNQNPLRGYDHRSPLEVIELGEVEQLMLEQQGYTVNSIPPEGTKIELRRNSNISTGGDSIDVTNTMDPTYKQLAAEMAEAMGAWVCGVDLIIPNATQAYSKDKKNATCIELNFNPLMYMHTYCQEGPGQSITPRILAKLFPEL